MRPKTAAWGVLQHSPGASVHVHVPLQVRHVSPERGPPREGWPAPWRHSTGGRVGLAFLGIAFLIATAIQLQGVLSSVWHADYRESLPRRARIAVFGLGHVGFAGRAGARV